MPRKLPSYFLPADPDTPCKKCDTPNRKTCRFCERCWGCCECSPTYICIHCEGYITPHVQAGSEMTKDRHECQCEDCAGKCGKVIMDRDLGNYLPERYEPYCDKCIKVAERNLSVATKK